MPREAPRCKVSRCMRCVAEADIGVENYAWAGFNSLVGLWWHLESLDAWDKCPGHALPLPAANTQLKQKVSQESWQVGVRISQAVWKH